MSDKNKSTCRICNLSEPEIKISRFNGKARAHNQCTSCRALEKRVKASIRLKLENGVQQTLHNVNLGVLYDLPHGNYYLKFRMMTTVGTGIGGILHLGPDRAVVLSYCENLEYPGPYDLDRLAGYLAYLHLIVSKDPAPELKEGEAEALLAKSGKPIIVRGVQ